MFSFVFEQFSHFFHFVYACLYFFPFRFCVVVRTIKYFFKVGQLLCIVFHSLCCVFDACPKACFFTDINPFFPEVICRSRSYTRYICFKSLWEHLSAHAL